MADDEIELVIKISKETYQGVVSTNKIHGRWGNDLLGILCTGIANGTQLPKGHGRLIDADALIDTLGCSDRDIYTKTCIEEDTPTIIEATNTESEE